jgi:hypothetical protein
LLLLTGWSRSTVLDVAESGPGYQRVRSNSIAYLVFNGVVAVPTETIEPGSRNWVGRLGRALRRIDESISARGTRSGHKGVREEDIDTALRNVSGALGQDGFDVSEISDQRFGDSDASYSFRQGRRASVEQAGEPVSPPDVGEGELASHGQIPRPELFVRMSAFRNDLRIDWDQSIVRPGTYFTSWNDARFAPIGAAAVGRYALPNPNPAIFVSQIKIPPLLGSSISFLYGTVAPKFGQAGGGVEVYFPMPLGPKSIELGWYQIPDY